MYSIGRGLQFAGILVTGFAFFDGVIGGHVRRELVLLAVGGAVFLLGRWLAGRR